MTYFNDPQQTHTNEQLTPAAGVQIGPNIPAVGPFPSVILNVKPYHQSLELAWIDNSGSTYGGVDAIVVGLTTGITYWSGTLAALSVPPLGVGIGLNEARPVVIPILGNMDAQIRVTFSSASGTSPSNSGLFFAAGLSTSPQVFVPNTEYGQSTFAEVVCLSGGATTTVIGAPPSSNQYRRVRSLTWAIRTAPAAGANVDFQDLAGNRWLPDFCPAAVTVRQYSVDVVLFGLQIITFHNTTNQNALVGVAYETWNFQ